MSKPSPTQILAIRAKQMARNLKAAELLRNVTFEDHRLADEADRKASGR